MEKIRLGIFDFFSYVLPGFVVLISFYVLLNPITGIVSEIMSVSKDFSTAQIFLVLIASYYIGVFMLYLSFKAFEYIGVRIWKKRLKDNKMSLNRFENDMAKIRHESPQNYQLLEKWMALRGMCYNSSFALAILFISLFFRMIFSHCFFCDKIWFLLLIVGIFTILSLRRAITFHEMSISTIKSTVHYLETKSNG